MSNNFNIYFNIKSSRGNNFIPYKWFNYKKFIVNTGFEPLFNCEKNENNKYNFFFSFYMHKSNYF